MDKKDEFVKKGREAILSPDADAFWALCRFSMKSLETKKELSVMQAVSFGLNKTHGFEVSVTISADEVERLGIDDASQGDILKDMVDYILHEKFKTVVEILEEEDGFYGGTVELLHHAVRYIVLSDGYQRANFTEAEVEAKHNEHFDHVVAAYGHRNFNKTMVFIIEILESKPALRH